MKTLKTGQQGLIAVLWLWVAGGIAVAFIGLGIAVKVQTARLDSVKAEYAGFRAQVEALGREAEKEAARVNLVNLKAMEVANAKTTKLLADNATLGKRLRDARARGGYVPSAPANSSSPDRACFDRAELERAIGNLDAGLQGIAEQGDAFGLRLSTAAEWAKSVGSR